MMKQSTRRTYDYYCYVCKIHVYNNDKHCCKCKIMYNSDHVQHCCECNMTYYKYEDHCCKCKLNYYKFLKHCCECNPNLCNRNNDEEFSKQW